MAEPRLPSRSRNNYVGKGHRIYANPDEFDYPGEKPVRWNGRPRRESKQAGSRYDQQEVEEEIRRAAVLLLARAGAFLSADMCESCSANLHDRLASIASGESLAATLTDSCKNLATELPICSEGSLGAPKGVAKIKGAPESFHYTAPQSADEIPPEVRTDDMEEKTLIDSPPAKILAEDGSKHPMVSKQHNGRVNVSRQEANGDKRQGNLAAVPSDATANLIIKTALHSLGNAPAHRTRSLSKKLGSDETAGQMNSSTSNSENVRISEVIRKKDFCLIERVNGQNVNILEGLELHKNVFNHSEQKELVDFVYQLQELGRNQKLRRRTYSEPRKWMRGKGRVTLQFGCCYNYAVDKDGNPPGIIRDEDVDDIPLKLRMVIKRLVQWQVLPSSCVPDSCIVNMYDVGDCIPPHIDHHDFVRPFCTLSLLSECDIIFGTNLKIVGPGIFKGSISIPLPIGSVLILNGNGADVAKHCVPAVPTQRISITFRKMDPTKVPQGFRPDLELLSTQPLMDARYSKPRVPSTVVHPADDAQHEEGTPKVLQFSLESDFPALAKPVPGGRYGNLRS